MPRERLSTAAPLQHSTTAHMATPATPATPLSRDRIPACPAIPLNLPQVSLGKERFFSFFRRSCQLQLFYYCSSKSDGGDRRCGGQQSAHVITSEHISFRGA